MPVCKYEISNIKIIIRAYVRRVRENNEGSPTFAAIIRYVVIMSRVYRLNYIRDILNGSAENNNIFRTGIRSDFHREKWKNKNKTV